MPKSQTKETELTIQENKPMQTFDSEVKTTITSKAESPALILDEKFIKNLIKKEVSSILEEKVQKIKIKKVSDNAVIPSRSHDTDSGWDLSVTGIHKIDGDTIFFKTGLQAEPPPGYYLEIYPRSSISPLPFMLANSVGIIDESYRGELIIAIRVLHAELGGKHERAVFPTGIVYALDAKPVSLTEVGNLIIAKKARIAQMILRKRISSEVLEVESLSTTERGSGGFGSTG